jgi:hypothetical protein
MQPRGGIVALLALAACRAGGADVVVHTRGGPVRVAVEVVDTPERRARGLMYRTRLDDDHGMLFVFPTDEVQSFWMKNTYIPLDLVFIGDDRRIVGIHAEATPHSEAPIGIGRPSRWVLEVPGGYTRRRGIAAGDQVELPPLP